MPLDRPIRRTVRQHTEGSYANSGRAQYINHPDFCTSPENYIRAFVLIQKDLKYLFDYIEPADVNLPCYSYRIHELLTRTCIEIEANFKAILTDNGYERNDRWNMRDDYLKVNSSHRLSSYQVKVTNWHGTQSIRIPFSAWSENNPLEWYQAYNQTKHDRHQNFDKANFSHLIDAVSGLSALMAAQFYTEDFSPTPGAIVFGGSSDGFTSGIGGDFRVKFPDDWPDEERYEFDWQQLKDDPSPFRQYEY